MPSISAARLRRLALALLVTAVTGAHLATVQAAAPAAALTLTVDAGANRKAISPYIYGLNFAKPAFAAEIGLPVRRWGGNTTSRYNWQINAINHGQDWFFHNNANYDPYTGNTETADEWVAQNASTGAQSLITIPMLGYVAKDTNQGTCGFNINKYGLQTASDAGSGYPDCGNGILSATGQFVAGNDPLDTSVASSSADAQAWVSHLAQTHGAANAGGVPFYALDNEPGIWNGTHRDAHPRCWTYADSIADGQGYATAIKTADPSALVLGPVQDGWQRYFYASFDNPCGATPSQDRQTYGDFIPWYLAQMKSYEVAHGVRLLDYLDLHFYPQNGVDQVTAGDATMQALRLRSVRALWDPTYVDESWIAQANLEGEGGIVRLLPRMRAWVNTYYPGTRLALTEYNWGGLEDINGALAQADILGLFGREGLDLATLWNYPVTGAANGYDHFETLPGAYAFRLYRNYDGAHSQFGDVSISAASTDQAQLSVYAAQRTGDGALTLMVLNKTAGDLAADVSLAGFTPGATAQVFRYSALNLAAIVAQPDQAMTAGGFSASFPANSLTLVVIPAAGGPPHHVYLPAIKR